jgi:hypothetical protein
MPATKDFFGAAYSNILGKHHDVEDIPERQHNFDQRVLV